MRSLIVFACQVVMTLGIIDALSDLAAQPALWADWRRLRAQHAASDHVCTDCDATFAKGRSWLIWSGVRDVAVVAGCVTVLIVWAVA